MRPTRSNLIRVCDSCMHHNYKSMKFACLHIKMNLPPKHLCVSPGQGPWTITQGLVASWQWVMHTGHRLLGQKSGLLGELELSKEPVTMRHECIKWFSCLDSEEIPIAHKTMRESDSQKICWIYMYHIYWMHCTILYFSEND